MRDEETRVTISAQQIAEIAGVGRSAVGNWRKRHPEFPVPDSSGHFDLQEVESWLIENDKIDSRAPAAVRAWSLTDNLRGVLDPGEITQFLVAALVYLEACAINSLDGNRSERAVSVNSSDSWDQVRKSPTENLTGELHAAAERVESQNPRLAGLLVPGLSHASSPIAALIREVIDSLEAAADESTTRSDLFEESLNRVSTLDRFRGDYSTPTEVARLMVRLAGDRTDGDRDGTVCDLACGEGGLLMAAALHSDRTEPRVTQMTGFEISDEAIRMARSRFFLAGIDVDLRLGDVFRVAVEELPEVSLALVDPPFGMAWGDADVYFDDRWTFGVPSRTSSDLAWAQLAIQCLAENGRAAAVTAPTALSGDRADAQVRRSMLEAGVVEAIIGLPGRMRANTSVPLALWVLRTPSPNVKSVLFVDASTLGTSGRSQHTFEDKDIDRLADVLLAHRSDKPVDSEIAWVVDVNEVIADDAILDPKRFRPAVDLDANELRERAEVIRARLPASAKEATDAIARSRDWATWSAGREQLGPNRVLTDVATILRSSGLAKFTDSEGGVPLIGTAEVLAGRAAQPRRVDLDELETQPVLLHEGDIVVALTGGVAQSMLVSAPYEGPVLARDCLAVRPTSPELTSVWTYIWTQSAQFRDQVLRHSSGTVHPRLSLSDLSAFEIPVPPLEDQRRAADLLQELDGALARVGEMHSRLEEYRELRLDLFVADLGGVQ